ncbi:MAG: S-methyl-5-thioribose-1-phosphate isomerase [Deltaproteobacteria bacterium]|nr:S-methyl-5-thioribose-1-phosphate isomerase [Deltaproteobacteria bacterium]
MKFKTIEWKDDGVRILDQRKLPGQVRYLECKDALSVAKAIRTMAIRGAPAIGVAAAMGIALAAQKIRTHRQELFRKEIENVFTQMGQTRPTAVNLFWAINRMRRILEQVNTYGVEQTRMRLVDEALLIHKEDIEVNKKIGEHGKRLIRNGARILTHCNAGALATAGYGTALGVIYAARDEGKRFHVFVDETRPMLQGCRLTAWELAQEKIPATLITDSMAGVLMAQGKINLVIVGADRIARNGDTANKIGTYGVAVLSRWHHVPFYVAAPTSTIDFAIASGKEIPIEERPKEEVTHIGGRRIAPSGVNAFNPAFDVTPHSLIEGIITEKGVLRKPFEKNLKKMLKSKNSFF